MNTETSSNSRAGLVAFVVVLAETPQFHRVAPPSNWMGTWLLRRLLHNALREQLPEPPQLALCFDLNRCFGLAEVSDRAAALRVIIAELEIVGLLPFTQLLWLDEREDLWRTHPRGCAGPDWLPSEFNFGNAVELSAELQKDVLATLNQ